MAPLVAVLAVLLSADPGASSPTAPALLTEDVPAAQTPAVQPPAEPPAKAEKPAPRAKVLNPTIEIRNKHSESIFNVRARIVTIEDGIEFVDAVEAERVPGHGTKVFKNTFAVRADSKVDLTFDVLSMGQTHTYFLTDWTPTKKIAVVFVFDPATGDLVLGEAK